MISKEFIISNEVGLHARPASSFVKVAMQYKADINIEFHDNIFNAKSIMLVLSAGITSGSKIRIIVDGEDEEDAMNRIGALIESNFLEQCHDH